MFINCQQFILLSLTIKIVSSHDLINFHVYQVGSRIFGDFKLPSAQIDSHFHFEQINASRCNFTFNSHAPNRFDLNGEGSIRDTENGVTLMSGRLVSSSARMTVNFTSEMSRGGQLTAQIHFNVTDVLICTYSIQVNEMDKCVPYMMKQNLTTDPPGLINYQASLRNLCSPDENGVNHKYGEEYRADLSSFKWPWMNATFDHYVNRNSTGGFETLNFTSYQLGQMTGSSDWTNRPELKKTRKLTFNSKLHRIPSFRLEKMIEGDKRSITFNTIYPNKDIEEASTIRPVNPHADDSSIW